MRNALVSLRRVAGFGVVLLVGSGLTRSSSQVNPGSLSTVHCDGLACGGSGGSSGSPFLYRVQSDGTSITFFEVGIEDPDPSHYGDFVHPLNWQVSIVASPRFHDEIGTTHGTTTSKLGTCPYVLRFEKGATGAGQTGLFEVGFAYLLGTPGYHDAAWKITGRQTSWAYPVAGGLGPVHSPMRLNVLLVVLDDVGLDKLTMYDDLFVPLGFASAGTKTPNLDELAASGIRFTNYYTNPLCSTSRAALMTGRYAFRTGVGAVMDSPFVGCADPVAGPCFRIQPQELFLPRLLRDGFAAADAYTCGAFGKWHLGYWTPDGDGTLPLPPPFPGLESSAVDRGFARFYGTMANVKEGPFDPDATNDHYNWWKVEHDAGQPPTVAKVLNTWSATPVRADAVSWINAQDGPFFAYVCFNPPHDPAQLPPASLLSPETQGTLASCTSPACKYAAMLEATDMELGNLLDGMDPAKRANTMVFVVADNGTPAAYIVGGHINTHGKATAYDLGVRVPMIVSGPLVPTKPTPESPPWVSAELVSLVDLWSTIQDITGASVSLATVGTVNCPGQFADSQTFLPVIRAPDQPGLGTREWVFSQTFQPNLQPVDACTPLHVGSQCGFINARAVSDGTFKLIRRRENIPGNCSFLPDELYCIGAPVFDLNEMWDFLGNPQPAPPPPGLGAAYANLLALMESLGN